MRQFIGFAYQDYYVEKETTEFPAKKAEESYSIRVAFYFFFFKFYLYYTESSNNGFSGVGILVSTSKEDLVNRYKNNVFKKITITKDGK